MTQAGRLHVPIADERSVYYKGVDEILVSALALMQLAAG